jgi:hypothetical protein
MANKLTFERFLEFARNPATPPAELREYLEFDPDSPIPRLSFRLNVLLDQPPATFDLDDEIRQIGRRRRKQEKSYSLIQKKRIVAEGDSWFDLPWFYEVYAIAERIQADNRFEMENVADYGHTIIEILDQHEYMRAIGDENPDFFMFSAGGNDLQEGLAKGSYIHDYDVNRPADEYLTAEGKKGLDCIGTNYKLLLNEVCNAFPELPIICHGYDCPPKRVLNSGGMWVGKYLKDKHGIPDDLMVPIVGSVLDKLKFVIVGVTSSVKTARYLDLRGKAGPADWLDDMHPRNPGFILLASKFEEAMSGSNK